VFAVQQAQSAKIFARVNSDSISKKGARRNERSRQFGEQLPQDLPEGVDLENESEEGVDVEEENHWEPGRIRVPRRLVWGIIILLGLVMAALALWGVAHSTWWY
jgi:hypothetical protein